MGTESTLALVGPPRLASGTEIHEGNRHLWLAERRRGIGASDAAAIVGASSYRSPLGVYLDKIGALEAEPETEVQRIGRLLEPVVATLYGEATGQEIFRQQVFVRLDGFPFATLDGIRHDNGIVEFKTVGSRSRNVLAELGEAGTDDIPTSWMYQCQWQMDVARRDSCDVAALIGGAELRLFRVHRHPRLIQYLWERTAEFWRRVEDRWPPEELRDSDLKHMATLHRQAVGEVELPHQVEVEAIRWEAIGKEIRTLQEERDRAKLSVLEAMGGAEWGRLPSGRAVRRQVVNVKVHEVRASSQVRIHLTKGADGDGEI